MKDIQNSKASVLLLTLIFMVFLNVIAVVYLDTVMVSNTNSASQLASTQALNLAEAGLNKAIYYLQNKAPDGSINGSWRTSGYPTPAGNYAPQGTDPASCTLTSTQPCEESLDGGVSSYTIWVVSWGTKIRITSAGTYNGLTRIIQVDVTKQPQGLVGWWKLNDAASGTCTTVADSSGNSNTGTCTGNPGWTAGQTNTVGALGFDGSTQYITLSDANLPSGNTDRTIAYWIKITGSMTSDEDTYLVRYGTLDNNKEIAVGLFNYHTYVTQKGNNIQGATAYNDGNWHQVVFVWQNSSPHLYLDGNSEVVSGSLGTVNTVLSGTLLFEETASAPRYMIPCKVDDIRIYNRALSAHEIYILYQQGVLGLSPTGNSWSSIVYGSRTNL
ncbi:MAG: LamG domain-containing protein [Candidatus Omnitrophica bacterium]|nr:LamG domain-containing protein [Candidatus Omnitrophota bacterium]